MTAVTTPSKTERMNQMHARNIAISAAVLLAGYGSAQANIVLNVTAVDGVQGITSKVYRDVQKWDWRRHKYVTVQQAVETSSWAGAWDAQVVSGGVAGTPKSFLAFCTDISAEMGNGKHTFSQSQFSTANWQDMGWADSGSGQRAAWVYNTHIQDVDTTTEYSAMCIAIWETLYEGSGVFDVTEKSDTGSSFKVTWGYWNTSASAAATLANLWLAEGVGENFAGYDKTWYVAQFNRCGDPVAQSLIGPVPEPSTIIAGALLLLPFGASAIRRFRNDTGA